MMIEGLFPYGKSGLKCIQRKQLMDKRMSLPVWEEWIEMGTLLNLMFPKVSLPVWEEWIEISCRPADVRRRFVSSRMGRVD